MCAVSFFFAYRSRNLPTLILTYGDLWAHLRIFFHMRRTLSRPNYKLLTLLPQAFAAAAPTCRVLPGECILTTVAAAAALAVAAALSISLNLAVSSRTAASFSDSRCAVSSAMSLSLRS